MLRSVPMARRRDENEVRGGRLDIEAWLVLPEPERWLHALSEPAFRKATTLTSLVGRAQRALAEPGGDPEGLARLALTLLVGQTPSLMPSYRADLLAETWALLTEIELRRRDLRAAELALHLGETAAGEGSGDPLVLAALLEASLLLHTARGRWSQAQRGAQQLLLLAKRLKDPQAEARARAWCRVLQAPTSSEATELDAGITHRAEALGLQPPTPGRPKQVP
jgi:hypothetical protein